MQKTDVDTMTNIILNNKYDLHEKQSQQQNNSNKNNNKNKAKNKKTKNKRKRTIKQKVILSFKIILIPLWTMFLSL